eukprot:3095222-Prorocentrum_lima.AAC.1
MKQVDHDLDVLQVQLGTQFYHLEVDGKTQVDQVPESIPYPRKRDLIVHVAKGVVQASTYLAYTIPEMEIKAIQARQMTSMCKNLMVRLG